MGIIWRQATTKNGSKFSEQPPRAIRIWRVSRPDLSDLIAEKERQLKDLESKGYKPLTIKERFERANMVEVYRSLYNFVSSDCHSNIRALVERHVDLGDDDFTPVLYKNPPDERFLWYLGPTAELLVSATIDIHERFETEARDEVRLFKNKLDEVIASELKPTVAGLP